MNKLYKRDERGGYRPINLSEVFSDLEKVIRERLAELDAESAQEEASKVSEIKSSSISPRIARVAADPVNKVAADPVEMTHARRLS